MTRFCQKTSWCYAAAKILVILAPSVSVWTYLLTRQLAWFFCDDRPWLQTSVRLRPACQFLTFFWTTEHCYWTFNVCSLSAVLAFEKNWRESLQCSRRVSELESNCKHVERFSYATSRANYGNRAAVCCLLKGGKNAPRKQHVSRFPKDISVTANRCYLLWSIMAADGCRQTNYARWKVVRTVAEYSMAGQYRFVPLGRHLVLFHVFYFGNGYTVLKTTCVNRHFGYMESFRVCLQKWMLLIPIFLLTNCKHYTEEIGVQVSYQQFCSVPSYVHTSKIKLNIDIHNDSKISLNGVNLMTVIRSNNWNVILKQIEVRNAASECRGVIK